MKKLVIALAAVAAFTGSASAADLAARPYTKAPAAVPAPVANWTGCYVGAGGGGAYTNNDHNEFITATGLPRSFNESSGARGWFGTVGAGCDYQFDRFVVGVFGDYDFMDVKGDIGFDGVAIVRGVGSQKQDWQWAVGGRVGYLITPQLLTYFSGGYTQAHWKSTNLTQFGAAAPLWNLPGATRGGWFIGAGDEYALNFLPGLFWKTEYRYSEFDAVNVGVNVAATGLPTGVSITEKFREHSVRSELVYRFNWGGAPVAAKY
ncbi:outer membrane protein [Bradyrhizobium sp. URHC0002]